MEQNFWESRWQQGQIGFHLPQPHPQLVQWGKATLGATGCRVLVPLCGKSQDLTWLEQQGYSVVGVEFVEQAARDYFSERRLDPLRQQHAMGVSFQSGGVSIYVGDFFKVTADVIGTFDAVYDRAALVAIDPSERSNYVNQLAGLVNSNANLLLLTLDHDLPEGPPFSVPRETVLEVYKGLRQLKVLAEVDALHVETRFRDRGATRMQEVTWAGQWGQR